jgi:hypothetical protein
MEIYVQLQNVKYFPVIIELTNKKGDIIATEYSENSTTIDFNLLEPHYSRFVLFMTKTKQSLRHR